MSENRAYTLAYFWTVESPDSKKIADAIDASPYSQVISTFSADSPKVRNSLMFGNHPQAKLPFFAVQEGEKFTPYPTNEVRKVLNLADKIIAQLSRASSATSSKCRDDSRTSNGTIGGLRAISDHSRISRVETDTEDNDVPSIFQ